MKALLIFIVVQISVGLYIENSGSTPVYYKNPITGEQVIW